MKNKILVTGNSVRTELLQPLIDVGFEVDNPTHLLSEAELKDHLKTASGYLLGGDEFASRDALSEADNLKVIAFLGMGYQSFIDVEAANEKRIPITNTPGTLSNSVAEFTVGLLLSSTRLLFKYGCDYSNGKHGNEAKLHDISALQIGIIGLGGIGTKIAEILKKGFNANISYFSRTRKPDTELSLGIEYLPFDDLLKNADVLIVMTPNTPETKGLLGSSEFDKMKNGVIIVNTARPQIIDPQALLSAIETDKIAYAAFDGFYDDNIEQVKMLKAKIPSQLMVTGHIGSLTHEARDAMANMATTSIINLVNGKNDKNIVNGL